MGSLFARNVTPPKKSNSPHNQLHALLFGGGTIGSNFTLDKLARAEIFDNADPKAVMFQTFAKFPHIGTNGGTAAGLVGSYETVAARIREFSELGIETFMLQFQSFEAEMRRFAHEVIPRVRRFAAAA